MKTIISIILIIAGIALFALFTNARYAQVRTLRAEAESFDSALERSKELIALRDSLLSKYNAFPSDNINRLNTMLPNSIDTVRLIIDINTLASRYGMSLSSISIGIPDESMDEGEIGPSSDEFGHLSLSFNVAANYDRFRAFLADLERSLRIIDVNSVSFAAPEGAVGLTNYSVSLTTYWLK
ncbi:MAG: type 4a pilus biogenesis protein PilO [Candidatus Pacebacteria bacterium]|nr:type 4a pilus biogenesis protein PilO [Candidatus Paceibacterota bacterium]